MVITTMWPGDGDAYVTAAGARRGARDPLRVAGRLIAGLDELALMAGPDPARGGIIDVPTRFTADAGISGLEEDRASYRFGREPDGSRRRHGTGWFRCPQRQFDLAARPVRLVRDPGRHDRHP